jgi:hypothetical protein
MEIRIKDDGFELILFNDELDNDNFIDLKLYGDEARCCKENTKGHLGQGTVSIDELKSAVDAFYHLRNQRLERDKLLI